MIFICGNCWKNRKKPRKIRALTNFMPHGILIDPISGIEPTTYRSKVKRSLHDSHSRYSCTRFQSLSVKFVRFGFWILIVRELPKLRIPDSTSKNFFYSGIRIPLHALPTDHTILYRDARLHGFLGEHLFLCFF